MNPVMSSEAIRLVHESMLRDYQALSRPVQTGGFRHAAAVLLVALGNRLDPSLRRPALPATGVRLRVA